MNISYKCWKTCTGLGRVCHSLPSQLLKCGRTYSPIDSVHLELRKFRDSGQSAAHTSLEVSDPKEILFNYTWQYVWRYFVLKCQTTLKTSFQAIILQTLITENDKGSAFISSTEIQVRIK